MSKQLRTPDNSFRPWPLFVLNEDYDDDAGLDRLLKGLEDMKRAGFGGVYLHPRPGLLTEYLSERWFEVIERLIAKCGELGLVPGLYDENSYPSGSAGGHTCSVRPETRSISIMPTIGEGETLPTDIIAAYDYSNGVVGEALENPVKGQSWIAFSWLEAKVLDWHGQVPVPNLLDPLTAKTFLSCTHDRYREKLSKEAQQAVVSMFTDEPHLVSDAHGPFGTALPLTPSVATLFRLEHGYDILNHLPELFFDVGDFAAIRFDYYDFCHRQWVKAWAEPLEKWHQAQGWKLTGHYLEHDWPVPYATPAQMEMLVHMDWPGTDLLGCTALAGRDYYELQNMAPEKPGVERHLLYYLRQVQSVANQFGKERVMNESWGAGGHASTPADWLRMGRFLIVNGVNHLVPHHAMTSIRGTRKHDHPQFFSAQSPWFDYLPKMNFELGRLSQEIAQGRMHNRVLVLDAQTSAYSRSRKSDCASAGIIALFSIASNSQFHVDPDELRRSVNSLTQKMADAQVDFDIGDEYILEKYAEATSEGQLRVKQQAYELIVWPAGLDNLRGETAELLEAYLGKGGVIAGVRPGQYTENGRASTRMDDWDANYCAQLLWTNSEDVCDVIVGRVPPRLEVPQGQQGVYHQRRERADGALWLLVNSSDKPGSIKISGSHSLHEIPLDEGATSSVIEHRIELGANTARMVLETAQGVSIASPVAESEFDADAAVLLSVERIEVPFENVLVLDRCEVRVGEESYGPVETHEANSFAWKAHSFPATGSCGVIQYRRQLLDRAESMQAGSGYTATYQFEVTTDAMMIPVELALETPELWTVSLNGERIRFDNTETWLDPSIRRKNISSLLQEGSNTIQLVHSPFDPRAELANIYLLGDFGLEPINSGFRLVAPQVSTLGGWSGQGRPFYDREYHYHFSAPADGMLLVEPGAWRGSWLIGSASDKSVQVHSDETLKLPVQEGEEICLNVVGLPFNLLGPWHVKDAVIGREGFSGSPFWKEICANIHPVAGGDYQLLDLGLFASPSFLPLSKR